MINVTLLDLAVIGDLKKQSPSMQSNHFFVLYVNSKEVHTSQRKPRDPPPHWKEHVKRLHFAYNSTIRIVIYRRSLFLKRFSMKKYVVAEFCGKGSDLLDKSATHGMTDESGNSVISRISVRLVYSSDNSYSAFMKAVDEDMSHISNVPGVDNAQMTTGVTSQLFTVLRTIVPIVDTFATTHPILNVGWTALSSAYKVMQKQIAEDDKVRDLVESLREMAGAASKFPNLQKIEVTIDIIEEIGLSMLEVATLINEYSNTSFMEKSTIFARTAKLSWTDMSTRVTKCQKRCKDLLDIFDRRMNQDNHRILKDGEIQKALEKLGYASGASWNPQMTCLVGTRSNIISMIDAWSQSLDSTQNVFWLYGVAGSGKSAIAHTVAQALYAKDLLTSAFFFDRDEDTLNTPRLLFTTIAQDIARRLPSVAVDIKAKLDADRSLAGASLDRHFDQLISKPLSRHEGSPPVVVIDALDEVIHDDSYTLLKILCDKISKLRMRVLITSRPTRDIVQYLSGQDHILSYFIDNDLAESRQDIRAFIDHELRSDKFLCKGSPNLDEGLIRDLEESAGGLFIWIAAAFRYLRNSDNLKRSICAILSKDGERGKNDPREKMGSLYEIVLKDCGDWTNSTFLREYHHFMGAIMTAKRPLSLGTLRALHNNELEPSGLPQRFGSVLIGLHDDREPVRALHSSFHEYITKDTQDDEKFHISEKEHNRRLALLCLQTMNREFTTRNIGGIGYLERDPDEPPGIPKVIGVSDQLLYSCEYWGAHISDLSKPNGSESKIVKEIRESIVEEMRDFLTNHQNAWMEVVCSRRVFLGSQSALSWSEDYAKLKGLCYNTSQAASRHTLSYRLGYEGRFEEALIAAKEAVTLREALVVKQPDDIKSNADLSLSLNILSNHLSRLGRKEEARTVILRAVDMRRILVSKQPETFNTNLASSLNNLSNILSDLNQKDGALEAIKEAVSLYRSVFKHEMQLAASNANLANLANLASTLNNLSSSLAALGQKEEALAVIQEAVDLYRMVAMDRPATFDVDLAMCLNNRSKRLAALGRKEDALKEIQEAVTLYRILAAERPAVIDANLASSLNYLSSILSDLG